MVEVYEWLVLEWFIEVCCGCGSFVCVLLVVMDDGFMVVVLFCFVSVECIVVF